MLHPKSNEHRTWLQDLDSQFNHVRRRGILGQVGWFARKGPVGAAKSGYRFARSAVATYVDHRFDAKYGTDTSGFTPPSELTMDAAARNNAFEYMPTTVPCFDFLMGKVSGDLSRFTFIDFGSGKGRTLILARERGFQQAVGIEFCSELVRVAVDNKARLEGQGFDTSAMSTIHTNALDYALPDGPCVLYFYAPFKSPVIDGVIDNVHATLQAANREIYIVYLDYVHEGYPIPLELLSRPPFTEVASGRVPAHFASSQPLIYCVMRAGAPDEATSDPDFREARKP